jgi:tetratricopeptide (TPR) repeat protein
MPDSDPPEPDSMHLYDLLDGFLQVHPQGDEADLEAWASGVPELASDPELVERLGELLYQVEAVLGELMPLEHRPGKVSIFRRRLADAIAGIADVVVSGLVRMLRPGRANGQRIEAVAEPYLREALEKSRRVLGDEHLDTLFSIDNRGNLLANQGKLTEAEPYFREALEIRRRVLGDEHEHTLHSIGNLC